MTPIAKFFAALRSRWSLKEKSRKHANKPTRGIFRPESNVEFKRSRRACQFMSVYHRVMKPVESKPRAQLIRKFKDRRNRQYAQLTTGAFIRL